MVSVIRVEVLTSELLNPFLRSHLLFVLRAVFDTIEHWPPSFSFFTWLLSHHIPVLLLPYLSVSFAASFSVPSLLLMCHKVQFLHHFSSCHFSGAVNSFVV